jgi:hypothetical protein
VFSSQQLDPRTGVQSGVTSRVPEGRQNLAGCKHLPTRSPRNPGTEAIAPSSGSKSLHVDAGMSWKPMDPPRSLSRPGQELWKRAGRLLHLHHLPLPPRIAPAKAGYGPWRGRRTVLQPLAHLHGWATIPVSRIFVPRTRLKSRLLCFSRLMCAHRRAWMTDIGSYFFSPGSHLKLGSESRWRVARWRLPTRDGSSART